MPGKPATDREISPAQPQWYWQESNDSGGSVRYQLEWCLNAQFVNCNQNVGDSDTSSFRHQQALTEGVWYLRVRAFDAIGNQSAYSEIGQTVVDATPPTVPTGFSGYLTTADTLDLRWFNSAADGFRIYRSDVGPDGGFSLASQETNYDYQVSLEPGENYWFYVKSVDSAGNESEPSNVIRASGPPATKEASVKADLASIVKYFNGTEGREGQEGLEGWDGEVLGAFDSIFIFKL